MLSVLLDVTIKSTRRASRSLARDYSELQMLQSTKADSLERFTLQSVQRGLELLQSELKDNSDFRVVNKLPTDLVGEKPVAHFMVLDGLRNLKRGMPYFANCISVYDNVTGDLKAAAVNFPALNEIFYCQAGNGVFIERFKDLLNNNATQRLRVSGTSNMANALVCFSHALPVEDIHLFKTKHNLTEAQIRGFGSNIHAAAMLVSGKIDMLYLAKGDALLSLVSLWVLEAGGRIKEEGNVVCFSNASLAGK